MIFVVRIAATQGNRFTHWTVADKIDAPLFTVYSNPFTAQTIVNTLLLLAIVYAVYCYTRETLRRQGEMEAEFKGAREVQQVLIPEALPPLPGYAVTSAYRPALEVGGDFFQIIPLEGNETGSALIVLGDVSGKGLKAALAVSLIVGTLRSLAESDSSPARILHRLNQHLYGRLRGGFATCFVLKLNPDGSCAMSNAGHPSPFINRREVALARCASAGTGGRCRVRGIHRASGGGRSYGSLHRRSAGGAGARELFGFERLSKLIALRPAQSKRWRRPRSLVRKTTSPC